MTSRKAATTPSQQSQPGLECCMCGDHGLSYELFKCKVCQFRSQHRYCSNLYPKAESYRICNWCLIQKDDSTEKTRKNSPNSSSSYRKESEDYDQIKIKIKIKKKNSGIDNHGALKGQRGTNFQLSLNSPIKKQRSPEGSPASAGRKRVVIRSGGLEEMLRRTKSEDISNSGITKQVFRNKVRRYKLLDEVSSQ